jgi:hypothetical protein
MAVLGLSHTYNTKGETKCSISTILTLMIFLVGDDYIRGVSGGERKRVR